MAADETEQAADSGLKVIGNKLENAFEKILFGARWLAAPIYAGLIAALAVLVWVFFKEVYTDAYQIRDLSLHDAVLMSLTLIDIALVANLVLVVVLAGYEHFVSKIHIEDDEDRPSWLKSGNFSGLKLKLFASIIAISGIELLRAFMAMRAHAGDGAEAPPSAETLQWLVIIHVTFLFTALLSALADCIASLAKRLAPPEEADAAHHVSQPVPKRP